MVANYNGQDELTLALSLARCFADEEYCQIGQEGECSIRQPSDTNPDLINAINKVLFYNGVSFNETRGKTKLYYDFFGEYIPACINWGSIHRWKNCGPELPEKDVFLLFDHGLALFDEEDGEILKVRAYGAPVLHLIAFVDNRHRKFGVDVRVVYTNPADTGGLSDEKVEALCQLVLENFGETILKDNPEKDKKGSEVRIIIYDEDLLSRLEDVIPAEYAGKIRVIYEGGD